MTIFVRGINSLCNSTVFAMGLQEFQFVRRVSMQCCFESVFQTLATTSPSPFFRLCNNHNLSTRHCIDSHSPRYNEPRQAFQDPLVCLAHVALVAVGLSWRRCPRRLEDWVNTTTRLPVPRGTELVEAVAPPPQDALHKLTSFMCAYRPMRRPQTRLSTTWPAAQWTLPLHRAKS
jgi:hypothetical protein